MNARRPRAENRIRREELETIRNKNRNKVLAHKPDMDAIHKIAYPKINEKIRARFELLKENKNTYEFLIRSLQKFTKDWDTAKSLSPAVIGIKTLEQW